MRLEQHFGYAGRGGEIAVDLKGRVRVEQVRIDPSAEIVLRFVTPNKIQQVADEPERPVAFTESGPKRNFPAKAPSRSLVSSALERLPGSREQLWRCPFRQLPSRVNAEHMGGMPMMSVLLSKIPQESELIAHGLLRNG